MMRSHPPPSPPGAVPRRRCARRRPPTPRTGACGLRRGWRWKPSVVAAGISAPSIRGYASGTETLAPLQQLHVVDFGAAAIQRDEHGRAFDRGVERDLVDQGPDQRDAQPPLEVQAFGIRDRRMLRKGGRVETLAPVLDAHL